MPNACSFFEAVMDQRFPGVSEEVILPQAGLSTPVMVFLLIKGALECQEEELQIM